jgi:hypothetical protein
MDEEDAGGGVTKSPIRRLGSTRKLLIFNSKWISVFFGREYIYTAAIAISFIVSLTELIQNSDRNSFYSPRYLVRKMY